MYGYYQFRVYQRVNRLQLVSPYRLTVAELVRSPARTDDRAPGPGLGGTMRRASGDRRIIRRPPTARAHAFPRTIRIRPFF